MKFPLKSPIVLLTLLLGVMVSLSIPALGQAAQVTTLEGWFSTIFGTPAQGSDVIPSNHYLLSTDDGRHFDLDIAPSVLQAAGGFKALNRQYVRVSLPAQTDRAVLTIGGTVSVQSLELAPVPLFAPRGAMASRDVLGSQPWVTILCAFPGTPVGYDTDSLPYFQGMYSDQFPGMDHYWRQQSFGKVNLAGSQTFGWFTLDDAQNTYFSSPGGGSNPGALNGLAQDCIDKADATVDFTPYEGINFMFNGELDCCAWGGGSLVQTDGTFRFWSLTWNPPWSWRDITVVSHEIGHGFGLPHANNYDNDSNPYDNTWDVMSDTYEFCYKSTDDDYGCLGQHTNAYYKDDLGWFADAQRLEVIYDRANITLDHVAMQNPQHYQIVLISIPGTSKKYVVEARQTDNSNYDAKLAGKAVIIHEIDESREEWAWLVGGTTDAKSKSLENDQANPDGAWLPGETYTDSVKGISVSVISETTNGFVISVDVPTAVDVISNGDIELATDNVQLPDDWVFKNLTGDKLKCNKSDKIVAYAGACAFVFKGGAGENSKLTQVYTPVGALSGTIAAELYTKGGNPAVSGKLLVKAQYTGGGKDRLKIDILPSADYVLRNEVLAASGNITKLKVMIVNNSTAGKLYVDSIKVTVE